MDDGAGKQNPQKKGLGGSDSITSVQTVGNTNQTKQVWICSPELLSIT